MPFDKEIIALSLLCRSGEILKICLIILYERNVALRGGKAGDYAGILGKFGFQRSAENVLGEFGLIISIKGIDEFISLCEFPMTSKVSLINEIFRQAIAREIALRDLIGDIAAKLSLCTLGCKR